MNFPTCRSCGTPLGRTVLDLGHVPLANEYPRSEKECQGEQRFPLKVRLCEWCWLLQLEETVPPRRLFSDYAYFSSYSDSWISHAKQFADDARKRWKLAEKSLVVEVASNDGYLLRHFVDLGIPVLGIDPAANVAPIALAAGVPTKVGFFGLKLAEQLAEQGLAADLVVANNVFAHVPDTNDFAAGLARVLAAEGVLSIEFPELATMLLGAQFDQIYHEHVFYFSLLSCESVLRRNGLRVMDVERLATHGGSLRVLACHDSAEYEEEASVSLKREEEIQIGLADTDAYEAFASASIRRAASVRGFLERAAADKKTVVGYGAAAKGNTLLNYCGVSQREIAYVVDRSPYKQGHFLPGTHLPVFPPGRLLADRPDYVLVLAWNLLGEVQTSLPEVRKWGGSFVTTMPTLAVLG
ncbi:MAG: methyltransferase domain-containing protein [Acidimicrobiales bacterium]